MKIKLSSLFIAFSNVIFAQQAENLGSKINSAYNEISPCPSADGLFFVRSNYPGNTFGTHDSQDIWYSKSTDTTWTTPIHLPVNAARYNAVLSVLDDGSILISGVFNKKGNFYRKRGLSICARQGDSWGAPKSLGLNVLARKSEGIFGGGTMSADGTKLAVAFAKTYNNKESDIFLFRKLRNGHWGSIDRLGEINTAHNEENPSFSADGRTLYFSSNRGGNSELYKSLYDGKKWSKPELVALKNVNTDAWESGFRVDPKEEWAYFSSNRPGGLGKADVFRVPLPGKKKYVIVKGLVRNVKTKALMKGENFTILVNGKPFNNSHVSTDSASYWVKLPKDTAAVISASQEHYTGVPKGVNAKTDLIKFDLDLKPALYALVTGKVMLKGTNEVVPGRSIRAILLNGIPLDSATIDTTNSTYTIRMALNKKHRLSVQTTDYKSEAAEVDFSRVQGFVKKEVNLFVEKHALLVISGKLLDKTSNGPVDISKNPVVAVEKMKDITVSYDVATGQYEVTMEPGEYILTGTATGYFPVSEQIDGKTDLTVKRDILLIPSVQGQAIQLNHILFVRGQATLLPDSDVELENLWLFMQQNPHVKILIGGHTDNRGAYNLNKKLSEDRAAAVRDFLIAKGISKGRLRSEGFGPGKPITSNNTEEGRQLNRRVEVTLVKM